jgi:IS4 transposase
MKRNGWRSNQLHRYRVGNKSKLLIMIAGATAIFAQSTLLTGPLLFVCYINDLPDVVRSLIYFYADDRKTLISGIMRIDMANVEKC